MTNTHYYLYQSCNRRVFTTNDVAFVETNVSIPDYSGNTELQLAGLHDNTQQNKEMWMPSERHNNVDINPVHHAAALTWLR